MRFILLSLMIVAVSCAPPENFKNENVQVAQKLFDAFNTHDWKAMAALYSDSAMFLDPSFGKDYVRQSREQTIAKYGEIQKIFPDIKDNVAGIYPSGDKVVAEFISTGKSDQGFGLNLPIVTVFTIHNGQIICDATYYDLENL
ncbi:MAG: nuclear transport factor 2 family protein [Chryseolinea sp.]